MSAFPANGSGWLRWFFTIAIAIVIVYLLPPQGISNGKFAFAIITGSGIALTGLWEVRLLKKNPEHPFKAIGLGAALRAVIVILAIIVVKFWLPPDILMGTAIGVMVVYFAVQIAELPMLIAIVGEVKKERNETVA